MKIFVILSVVVAGAVCARLDNTYIPPANAHSAGGFNLDAPKQAHASNIQNTYAAPGGGHTQTQYQHQSQPGLNQGTFTSVSKGNGFQSVSTGSFSGSQGAFRGQPSAATQYQQNSYQAPTQNYQPQPQPSYQSQQNQHNNYQQTGYNGPSTTPIPILECKKNKKCHIAEVKE